MKIYQRNLSVNWQRNSRVLAKKSMRICRQNCKKSINFVDNIIKKLEKTFLRLFSVKSICRKIEEKLKAQLQRNTDKFVKNIVQKFLALFFARPVCKKT